MTTRLPDFLGIGTQKGGTTSLHQWLSKHHQTYLPKCKEVHYFDLNYENGEDWYLNHFKEAGKNQLCGEITPMYMYQKNVPARIKSLVPHIKMIALLRDPAERTISQLCHAKQRKFESLEPWEAIEAEKKRLDSGEAYSYQKHSYISRSRYLEQLERYENIFKKEQLLVVKSEDLFIDNQRIWKRILNFLELEDTIKIEKTPKANTRKISGDMISEELRHKIRTELMETAKGVRERYGFGWDWA